jgi:hypothetical protein
MTTSWTTSWEEVGQRPLDSTRRRRIAGVSKERFAGSTRRRSGEGGLGDDDEKRRTCPGAGEGGNFGGR